MKKISLLLMPILLMLAGCTQNNGHIGHIFGSWALQEITEDGHPYPLAPENTTVFAFQNEIVRVTRLSDSYSYETRTGNFSLSGSDLTMKFAKDPTPTGSYMFVTPQWLPIPKDGKPIHFHVDTLKGDNFDFSLDYDGHEYIFHCTRTW